MKCYETDIMGIYYLFNNHPNVAKCNKPYVVYVAQSSSVHSCHARVMLASLTAVVNVIVIRVHN